MSLRVIREILKERQARPQIHQIPEHRGFDVLRELPMLLLH